MNVTSVTPEATSQTGTALGDNTAALTHFDDHLEGAALIEFIRGHLEDGKAEEILTIDLNGKSSFADAMIIASGRSNRQVAALCDRLTREAKNKGLNRLAVEGLPQADWVLIDFGEVIVHLFRPEVRTFYNLEKMWAEPETTATA
ncbi:MAG: ribosome silencing factor [Pseudomonadota bacterium]